MQTPKDLHLKSNQTQTIFDMGNKIQINNQTIKPWNRIEIHIPQNSTLKYYFNWQNISINRNITIHLNKKNASAELIGLFYSQKTHQIKLNSTIVHHTANTFGNTFIKGALQNASKAQLQGLIKINKKAHESNDLLTEKILLLSPQARAEIIPMLEIDANQVKASHAATISKINQNHLYYLQTRGLDKNQAQQFITHGFLQEIFDKFPKTTASVSSFFGSYPTVSNIFQHTDRQP